MICYVLAMGKQHLGPRVVVGYGIKMFWPGLFIGLFITSPDHLAVYLVLFSHDCCGHCLPFKSQSGPVKQISSFYLRNGYSSTSKVCLIQI